MSIKRFARNSTATLALVFAAFSAQAASYTPTGVQNDVDYNSVLNGGWKIVYQGAYGATTSISDLFGSIAAGSKVMLAAKNIASSVFDVLAWAGLEEVTQYTGLNQTHQANGVEWYYNGYSMGFAGAGDTNYQNSADTNGQSERDRLSWHTSISEGWNKPHRHRLNTLRAVGAQATTLGSTTRKTGSAIFSFRTTSPQFQSLRLMPCCWQAWPLWAQLPHAAARHNWLTN